MNNPTFLCTTNFTKWQQYSKRLVQKFYPDSKYIEVDGKVESSIPFWFRWLDHLKDVDTQNFVLLDEDCFILNRNELEEAIQKVNDSNSTLAGVPDAFYTLRNYNEVALNPFFLIGDTQKLLNCLKNPVWQGLRFDPKYFATAKYPYSVESKKIGTAYEPFYCLFWAVLDAKEKLYYLYPHDDFSYAVGSKEIPATSIRLQPDSPDIALHAWYSRVYMQTHHKPRYQKIETYLNTIL